MRPCDHSDCAEFGACVHICPARLVKVSGERYSPEQLAKKVLSYRVFFGERGGVTFSGGEPLMQADFIEEVMPLLGDIRFGVETCAHVPAEVFDRMMPKFHDRFVDMKHMDADTHRRLTGQDNTLILRNITALKASGLPFTVRIPLIPGVNDTAENLAATAAFLADAKDRVRVELLPYNQMTGAKYRTIGRVYNPPFDEKQKPNKDVSAFVALGIDCHAY
jgi:pyruvate formate lyase activating enzyme